MENKRNSSSAQQIEEALIAHIKMLDDEELRIVYQLVRRLAKNQ